MDLLETSNQKLDAWYLRHSTDVDPVYQSYSKPQDRDRMKIPYNLIRMYVSALPLYVAMYLLIIYQRYTNGYVLHGLKPGTSSIHPLRIHFIKIAVDASVELLDCALHSMNYQMTLKYSIVSYLRLL